MSEGSLTQRGNSRELQMKNIVCYFSKKIKF